LSFFLLASGIIASILIGLTTRAVAHNLKSDAFSPISTASTFGVIADKCEGLVNDYQRGHHTDAELVQLGEQTTCLSFIFGFLEGYGAREAAVSDKSASFCIPPDVDTAQILKTFLGAADAHPEIAR
jgi:hypothetical protein